jgi:hypothetical protein
VTRFRRLTARRAGVRAGLVAVVVGVLTCGYLVVSALAVPTVPAPKITGSPANPTTSLRCSTDGSVSSFCPRSGSGFADLADGLHTGPTITLTFPADHDAYNAARWSTSCPRAGICGFTADPDGVKSVAVSIYQESSRRYWTGSSFSSYSRVFNTATGTTRWTYGFRPPRDGWYRLAVQATDDRGNTSFRVADFRYDTAPPPAPRITREPSNPSEDTNPEFQFVDREWPHVTFWCSLDSGRVQPCTGDTDHDHDRRSVEGELQLKNVSPGPHCFSVYATDEAGNNSSRTRYCWTVRGRSSSFTVGGSLTSPLYPGTSEPLDLTFTNPSSSPITIAAGGVGSRNIAITTSQAGCAGSNFEVSQGLAASVTIPARQTTPVSLSSLSIPQADWPVITMINTNGNQDACEGAPLTLTYSGIEASG